MVAAGIDNVLKIRLNVCPVKDIERVENFLYKLVGLYAKTGTRMAGDELSLGIPYVVGDAVITRCYTAGIVWSLRPRAPVVESSERLKVAEMRSEDPKKYSLQRHSNQSLDAPDPAQ